MDTQPAYTYLPVDGHDLVEGVWQLNSGKGDDVIAPDTSCEIIFHLGTTPFEWDGTDWQVQPKRMLYGPLTRALRLRKAKTMKVRAIRLTPAGIGLIHNRPALLRNASHALDAVLEPEIVAALSEAARTSLSELHAAAQRHLPTPDNGMARRIAHARRLIKGTPDIMAGQLAGLMGVSIRTLDRTFMRQTGLRPGEFIRIFRYHAARQAIENGGAGLADIAIASGYADQAHMTREFSHFAGLTPRRKQAGEGLDVFYSASSST